MIYRTARKDGHLIKQLMTKKATLQSSETDELLDFDLSSLLEVIGSYIYAGGDSCGLRYASMNKM